LLFDGSTARKMHPVTVDASAPRRMTATAQAAARDVGSVAPEPYPRRGVL